jgi:NAD-specific glutamate dehydrogenase
LSREILSASKKGAADFAAWESENGGRLARAKAALDEMATTGDVTVSRLTVAASQVRELTSG